MKKKSLRMTCGHTANAHKVIYNDDNTKTFVSCCIICNCTEPDINPPSLEGRISKCNYCKSERKSHPDLPFFKHNKDKEYDEHYCGCRGWN